MMKDKLHPAVQILVWVILALLVQRLQGIALFVLCAILIGLALRLCAAQFLNLLRRTRWIVISLLLIYAYTTPGVALIAQLGLVSPTLEGLSDGATQLGRLIGVLAGLAILLTLLSQNQMISGLYSLMYSLSWLGLSRERFAVRLALTLENAESVMRDTASDWRSTIGGALKPNAIRVTHIELDVHAFRMVDALILVACAVLMVGVW